MTVISPELKRTLPSSINTKRKKRKNVNIIQELIKRIEEKNSWGKNELIRLLLDIMAKHYKD